MLRFFLKPPNKWYLLDPESLDGGVVDGAGDALRRELRQHRLLLQERRGGRRRREVERVGPPPPPQRPLTVYGRIVVLVVDPAVALPQGPDPALGRRILKLKWKV